MAANHEPQATEQFFGAAVLQKLLDQKTFILPAARILQPIIYKITPFSPVFANSRKTSNRNP